jgi:hypothetical protein
MITDAAHRDLRLALEPTDPRVFAAEAMTQVRRLVNGAFADPGSKKAHAARGAAAVTLHRGGTIAEAVETGLAG